MYIGCSCTLLKMTFHTSSVNESRQAKLLRAVKITMFKRRRLKEHVFKGRRLKLLRVPSQYHRVLRFTSAIAQHSRFVPNTFTLDPNRISIKQFPVVKVGIICACIFVSVYVYEYVLV